MGKYISVLALLLSLSIFCNAQSDNIIEPELQKVLNRRNTGLVSINIVFESKIDLGELKAKIFIETDKERKRALFVNTLKEFSRKSQSAVLSYLESEEEYGRVANIKSHWITNVISCDVANDVVYELANMSGIDIIGHNAELQILQKEEATIVSEAVAYSGNSATPHVLQINADDVWALGYTGKNVVVAVLDSGTNPNHYDLKDHLWCGYADTDGDGEEDDVIHGWNFIADNENIEDDYGHGTHCAGIVCGDGTVGNVTGVAPDATLMTVKIVNRAGGGSPAQMISGVEFAIANGADILSMSLGFKMSNVGTSVKKSLRDTFVYALEAGVVVCAAAGNDGENYVELDNVDIPAACPPPYLHDEQLVNAGGLSSVVCVGAVNESNGYASFSSRGPVTWQDVAEYNDYLYDDENIGLIRPDICAPGNLVYSLKHDENDKYKFMSGTSQATPCVAGVMALMLEKNSNLTPADICRIMETTAVKLSDTKNNYTGSGMVDALAAINSFDAANEKPYIQIENNSSSLVLPGKTCEVYVALSNIGKAVTSDNATVTLSTNDKYVTISNPEVSLGVLEPNEAKYVVFDVNMSSEMPDGHTIIMTATVNDSGLTWSRDFTMKVKADAKIIYVSNSPTVIEAGKEVELSVDMINKGTIATVNNSKVTLSTSSPYVTFIEDEAMLGAMGINEVATANFKIKVDSSIPDNSNISFDLYAVPENYTLVKSISYEFEQGVDEYGYLDDGLNGWTTFDASNDDRNHPWWHSSKYATHKVELAGSTHSGNGQLMSESYCQASMQEYNIPIDNYLVSPRTRITENSKFSFWARAHMAGYYKEHFGVAISENGNESADDFTTIKEWSITDSETATDWIEYTVDLSEYSGKDIYVAIRHFFTQEEWTALGNGLDLYILHIDDVTFSNIIDVSNDFKFENYSYFSVNVSSNPLPAPDNVVASASGENSVLLSWDAVEHAMSYNIYRNGEYLANTTNLTYSDTGLTSDTEYGYSVAAVYNGKVYELSSEVLVRTIKADYSLIIKEVSPETLSVGENTISLTILNNGKYEQQCRSKITLSCLNSSYVTIKTNNVGLSALDANAESVKSFDITIDNGIPDGSVVEFNASIVQQYDPYLVWDCRFSVVVGNDEYVDINALKEEAKALVENWVGVGYPNATAIENYLAAVGAATNAEDITVAQSALYASTDIMMPEDGKAYTIKSVQKNGEEQYFKHTSSSLTLSSTATEATAFICRALDNGKFVFVNNEGKYLVWRGSNSNNDGADTSHRGYVDTYSSEWCDLEVTTFVETQWVSVSLDKLVGYLNIKGKRSATDTGCLIIKASTGTSSAAFDTSNSPYYNNSYSSALVFTEVEYANTPELKDITGSTLISGFDKNGLATFSAPFPTVLPEGITAYYATSDGQNEGCVSLTEYTAAALPANEGFILVGEPNEQALMAPAAGEAVADLGTSNILGNSAGRSVSLSAGQCYLLGSVNGNPGFYACGGGTLAMNKAYLNISSAASRSIVIRFPGATDIDDVVGESGNVEGIYDLTGRKIEEITTPGIYIVNGKKVLVK